MNTPPRKISGARFLVLVFSALVGFGVYNADVANQPVIAPLLDKMASHLYAWMPALEFFPSGIVNGVVIGLIVFILGAFVMALWQPNNAHDRLENQLKKRSGNPKKHRAGIAR